MASGKNRGSAVRPTEPKERAAVAAAQAAEESAAEPEQLPPDAVATEARAPDALPGQLPLPLYMRAEDAIAKDVQAVVVFLMGGARWLFAGRSPEKRQRMAAAHVERDPSRAEKVGRGIAKSIIRRQLATVDAVFEWLSLGADVADEFVTEGLRDPLTAPGAPANKPAPAVPAPVIAFPPPGGA